MSSTPPTELIDGVTFELRPNMRMPSNPESVCLRKLPKLVERYKEIASEMPGGNMIEVGIDQGGGTSFFAKLFRPKKLLAIELSQKPVATLVDFLAEHDPDGRVRACWGVDQSDRVAVPRLVEDAFGDEKLDIVVDDASHLLDPTTATFEMLFPRLRPGGVYIIEDWSTDHVLEHYIDAGKASAEDLAHLKELGAQPGATFKRPLSLLICQLLVASARNAELIPSIRTFRGFCEIRRGAEDIEPGTPLSSYIGKLGEAMFENSLV